MHGTDALILSETTLQDTGEKVKSMIKIFGYEVKIKESRGITVLPLSGQQEC
jgi:hypothetical protein